MPGSSFAIPFAVPTHGPWLPDPMTITPVAGTTSPGPSSGSIRTTPPIVVAHSPDGPATGRPMRSTSGPTLGGSAVTSTRRIPVGQPTHSVEDDPASPRPFAHTSTTATPIGPWAGAGAVIGSDGERPAPVARNTAVPPSANRPAMTSHRSGPAAGPRRTPSHGRRRACRVPVVRTNTSSSSRSGARDCASASSTSPSTRPAASSPRRVLMQAGPFVRARWPGRPPRAPPGRRSSRSAAGT